MHATTSISFPFYLMNFTGLKMSFGFWLSFVDSFSVFFLVEVATALFDFSHSYIQCCFPLIDLCTSNYMPLSFVTLLTYHGISP